LTESGKSRPILSGSSYISPLSASHACAAKRRHAAGSAHVHVALFPSSFFFAISSHHHTHRFLTCSSISPPDADLTAISPSAGVAIASAHHPTLPKPPPPVHRPLANHPSEPPYFDACEMWGPPRSGLGKSISSYDIRLT
jgi:hypothetical protein